MGGRRHWGHVEDVRGQSGEWGWAHRARDGDGVQGMGVGRHGGQSGKAGGIWGSERGWGVGATEGSWGLIGVPRGTGAKWEYQRAAGGQTRGVSCLILPAVLMRGTSKKAGRIYSFTAHLYIYKLDLLKGQVIR